MSKPHADVALSQSSVRILFVLTFGPRSINSRKPLVSILSEDSVRSNRYWQKDLIIGQEVSILSEDSVRLKEIESLMKSVSTNMFQSSVRILFV